MDIIDIKNNRFNLVLCELFNRHIHGSPGDNIKELDGHYLLISKFNGQSDDESVNPKRKLRKPSSSDVVTFNKQANKLKYHRQF